MFFCCFFWTGSKNQYHHVLRFYFSIYGWSFYDNFLFFSLNPGSCRNPQTPPSQGPDDALGPLFKEALHNIKCECQPLLRQLPDDEESDTNPYQPRKWVMLRYPWQAPVTEESTIPHYGNVPGDVMNSCIRGMLRRTFGKDSFAKTLLQSGCSASVLAEYKRQDDFEHATQALIDTMMASGATSLADDRQNLKRHEQLLKRKAQTTRGYYRSKKIQQDLEECQRQLANISHQSGASYDKQAIQGHFKKNKLYFGVPSPQQDMVRFLTRYLIRLLIRFLIGLFLSYCW